MTNESDPVASERAVTDPMPPPHIDDDPRPRIARIPDHQLVTIAELGSRNREQPRFELGLEMQRRLKVATEKLTTELVMLRDSTQAAAVRSEAAARRSEESAARLERLTRWLISFTVMLVVLTVAVLALTAVLAAKK